MKIYLIELFYKLNILSWKFMKYIKTCIIKKHLINIFNKIDYYKLKLK